MREVLVEWRKAIQYTLNEGRGVNPGDTAQPGFARAKTWTDETAAEYPDQASLADAICRELRYQVFASTANMLPLPKTNLCRKARRLKPPTMPAVAPAPCMTRATAKPSASVRHGPSVARCRRSLPGRHRTRLCAGWRQSTPDRAGSWFRSAPNSNPDQLAR